MPWRFPEDDTGELDPEQLGVARLDLLARLLDAGRIVLHLLDLPERPAARLFLGLRVHGAQAADVDQGLLALHREAIALEQAAGIRIGRGLEQAVGADDERGA